MNDIVVAALFFVGTHIGIAATPLRAELIERVGERLYRLLFSLVSVVALVWLIIAYGRAPTAPLSFGAPWLAGLPALVMPIALLLLVTALSQPNPTAVGQAPDPDAPQPARGMLRVTRHPLMWGIALWAASHLLANPDTASVVFFGAFVVLALGGAVSLDQRRSRENAPGWGVFLQCTSFLPFAAIVEGRQRFVWAEIGWARLGAALLLYALLVAAHPWLFGVPAIG
ncbi:MAG: NnrU family protein [Geminicoccaceae bacterium]|jgi:uncharacterized membrane protein|nr:NnrU family protein [Geminicoccaceae bacterium]